MPEGIQISEELMDSITVDIDNTIYPAKFLKRKNGGHKDLKGKKSNIIRKQLTMTTNHTTIKVLFLSLNSANNIFYSF